MDFKDVNIWLMLSNERNITKAAKKLYISQPALTNRIKKTEEEFNTPLIIRNHDGIQFTQAGQKMIRDCQILKNDYTTLQSDLFSNANEVQGSLTIGVTSIFARHRLPGILKSYLEENPQIKVNVRTGRSWDVYPLLKNQKTLVAILREGYAWGGRQTIA